MVVVDYLCKTLFLKAVSIWSQFSSFPDHLDRIDHSLVCNIESAWQSGLQFAVHTEPSTRALIIRDKSRTSQYQNFFFSFNFKMLLVLKFRFHGLGTSLQKYPNCKFYARKKENKKWNMSPKENKGQRINPSSPSFYRYSPNIIYFLFTLLRQLL